MLIVLGNETIPERCNQPLWINDLNIQIRSTLGNNFRIVAENFKVKLLFCNFFSVNKNIFLKNIRRQ